MQRRDTLHGMTRMIMSHPHVNRKEISKHLKVPEKVLGEWESGTKIPTPEQLLLFWRLIEDLGVLDFIKDRFRAVLKDHMRNVVEPRNATDDETLEHYCYRNRRRKAVRNLRRLPVEEQVEVIEILERALRGERFLKPDIIDSEVIEVLSSEIVEPLEESDSLSGEASAAAIEDTE